MAWFFIIVGSVLLLVATPIALWWWRLVQKAAPYRDESGKGATPGGSGDEADIVVIPTAGPRQNPPAGGH